MCTESLYIPCRTTQFNLWTFMSGNLTPSSGWLERVDFLVHKTLMFWNMFRKIGNRIFHLYCFNLLVWKVHILLLIRFNILAIFCKGKSFAYSLSCVYTNAKIMEVIDLRYIYCDLICHVIFSDVFTFMSNNVHHMTIQNIGDTIHIIFGR